MGKKGKKTRWRRLPIGGTDEESGLSLEPAPPITDSHRITFNEDEYTKITTPRQDVLFKKGYFGRKRTPNPSPSDTQEVHSGDSVESESYVSEEPQYAYPAGYMDSNGVYYVNGNTFETYDPYTGTVTVVVGPPAQYPGTPVLAALPCQPVPLQPVEWFNPAAPWCYSYNRRKRYSTDSQNCSAQSSESTGPPGSPQEPVDEGACAVYPPQYVYPGYMFGPPIYNVNGVTVQGVIPQPVSLPPDLSASKRRKKRRRRRRGGVTDDGSESSCCEEPLTCDVPGCQSETSSDAVCQSGASSDAGVEPGSISSKANSDSGINTDPTPNSGSNSPPLHVVPTLAQVTDSVNSSHLEGHLQHEEDKEDKLNLKHCDDEDLLSVKCMKQEFQILPLCFNNESVDDCVTKEGERSEGEVITPGEVSEELSTAEDDITPNLCAVGPEFSSQDSTLSCVSTPSANRDLLINESETINVSVSQEEVFESCQSTTESCHYVEEDHIYNDTPDDDSVCQSLSSAHCDSINLNDDLKILCDDNSKGASTINENSGTSLIDDSDEEINRDIIPEITSFEERNLIQYIENGSSNCEGNKGTAVIILEEKQICEELFRPEVMTITNSCPKANLISEIDQSFSRFSSCRDTLAPVPPPRRKRSMCRAADKLATRIVDEAIKKGLEEAVSIRIKNPMSITEAVTRWLNSQESSPLTCPTLDSESNEDDDEGIEVGEGSTDQKNVRGNPFLVSSHSGTGQRVAKDCDSIASSAGEWDMWDSSHTRDMCDPARSVDKYYRLGAEDGSGDKVPPSVYKTAMHIRHTGPFPCGVCCIIQ